MSSGDGSCDVDVEGLSDSANGTGMLLNSYLVIFNSLFCFW